MKFRAKGQAAGGVSVGPWRQKGGGDSKQEKKHQKGEYQRRLQSGMSLTSLGSVAGEEVCLDLATELPGNCSAEDPTCMTDERLQSVSCILH
jgi:hypothetical protein